MKKPNQELFRLLRFAIRFPGWHIYDKSLSKHIKRGHALGFFDMGVDMGGNNQFRLKATYYIDCHNDSIHGGIVK